jgi:beta-mannosidase
MQGLSEDRRRTPFFDDVVPGLIHRLAPGTPYVSSNPTGGTLPFRMDEGVSQYFGVGGYLRPLDDPRRSGVRFAAECLLLATPPEVTTVEAACGGPLGAGHDPTWKATVYRDAGQSWDMEDVGAFYARELFGIDPLMVRYLDPERMLELRRATNAELVSRVFTEWRRPGSPCDGGLIVALGDFVPGPGWGLVDALGVPKSTWYALRRVSGPVGLLMTDEGLNGLALHLMNDTASEVGGTVRVQLYSGGERAVDQAEQSVKIDARSSVVLDAETLLEGFRDITYAYRFGPPAYDLVAATFLDAQGALLSQAVHLFGGQGRPRESDIGLEASLVAGPADRGWTVEVSTRRLAQWVSIEVPGYLPGDSWFHLPPGSTRVVPLRSTGTEEPPLGTVRAVNWEGSIRLRS